jgi:hypothetical protein
MITQNGAQLPEVHRSPMSMGGALGRHVIPTRAG